MQISDLGGSSKYSNERFEDRSGEGFHVNSSCGQAILLGACSLFLFLSSQVSGVSLVLAENQEGSIVLVAVACFAIVLAFKKGLRAKRVCTFGCPRGLLSLRAKRVCTFGCPRFLSFRLVAGERGACTSACPLASFVRVVSGWCLHFSLAS